MLSNTALDASGVGLGERTIERQGARSTTAPLAALLLGLVYPLTPPLLYSLAAGTTSPLAHFGAILAGTLLVLAIPIVGAALIWRSAGLNDVGSLRARGMGMLLVISPVLAVMIPSVMSGFGIRMQGFLPVWGGFWVASTGVVAWRSTMPRPILSSQVSRAARRAHRMFLVLLVAFVVGHLAVNLTALDGIPLYNQAAGWFRLAWRTPVAEPILIALLALQLMSGLVLALDASGGRSTIEHLAQITAGLFLAAFVVSHTTAVAVLGRTLLDRGPDFTFASAGPNGLLGSAGGTSLFPYYGLAVVALTLHLARPLRLWAQRRMAAGTARISARALIGTGIVVSVLLLLALLNPMR